MQLFRKSLVLVHKYMLIPSATIVVLPINSVKYQRATPAVYHDNGFCLCDCRVRRWLSICPFDSKSTDNIFEFIIAFFPDRRRKRTPLGWLLSLDAREKAYERDSGIIDQSFLK